MDNSHQNPAITRPIDGLQTHFYQGLSQREALARLRFLITQSRALGLVIGDTGMGKSLLLRTFAEQGNQAGYAVARVSLKGLSAADSYWQLGSQLQCPVNAKQDNYRSLRQLCDRLYENALLEKRTVLILDDLDRASEDLSSHIYRLLHSPAAQSGWLTTVAAANPQGLANLNEAIRDLVDLRINLQPWDELDTVGYVQQIQAETGLQQPLFDNEMMSELYRASAGVPRKAEQLVHTALQFNCQQETAAAESISLPNSA